MHAMTTCSELRTIIYFVLVHVPQPDCSYINYTLSSVLNCMHHAGVRDRSGFNLTYLSTGRKYDAGVLEVGHTVLPTMVVPGRAVSYSIFGECSSSCTSVCSLHAC